MEKFRLCNKETEFVKKTKDMLKNYGKSNKELFQKENELFHVLCFYNLDNKLSLCKNINPNEPGDFVLKSKNKKILIEVAECFGNRETYTYMNNQLNILFDRKNKNKYHGDYNFSINEAKSKLGDIIIEKNGKDYNKNNEYDEVDLLIVTGEYENCPVTGNWLVKFLNKEDIDHSIYKIHILNYFASSKDEDPIIIKDLSQNISEYQSFFNDEK